LGRKRTFVQSPGRLEREADGRLERRDAAGYDLVNCASMGHTLASTSIEAQPQMFTGARHGEALPELFAER